MMDAINEVMLRMHSQQDKPALYWNESFLTYDEFMDIIDSWDKKLDSLGVFQGTVCGVMGEYSPQACAVMYALMKKKAIIVPFTRAIEKEIPIFSQIAGVECMISFNTKDEFSFERFSNTQRPELIKAFLNRNHPGLVVFSSGSTGVPKGILQDCEQVMRKFVTERPGWCTVLFLLMDHFGGFNTLLSTFAYGGVGVCLSERTPETVCKAVEKTKATLLPTTPTFLNFLISSGVYRNFDLSSIKLITYGTELMAGTTLEKVKKVFSNAKLKQTYGLSELGVLRSKSEDDNSTWVKLGGDGFDLKIIDNILWVRSEANMVGYLNAPNPINEEGWMCTGDQVEVKGEYVRFLGRKSEIINVGGQKVFPAEVEGILLQANNIAEVAVYGKKHPILGQVVYARISLFEQEPKDILNERLRKFCFERLAKYKIPIRFEIVSKDEQHSERFKKLRKDSDVVE